MPAKNTLHQSFKEIAKRYSIPEDQIQTILDTIKIKSSEKPSDEQIQGFEKVCDKLRSGVELNQAVAAIHEEAKNQRLEQQTKGQPEDSSLTVANNGAISTSEGKEFAEELNWQGLEQSVKEVAQHVAPAARQKFVKGAADEANHVSDGLYAYGRYVMHEELREEIGKGQAKYVKEEIIKAIRTGKSPTDSTGNSP